MRDKKHWDQRYRDNDLPWDTGRPDTYLVALVADWPPCRGKVLEIGCGTGTNVLWLASQGFDVLGIDMSSDAVEIARERAEEAGIGCDFAVGDFHSCPLDENGYMFIFDRGCFHSIPTEKRAAFVERVASCLQPGGLWFSLMGNPDDNAPEGKGPPRLRAAEITAAVEPAFEILQLRSCLIESRKLPQPRFWQCLMRVRNSRQG
jgi:SAM-dependent methyltransferase